MKKTIRLTGIFLLFAFLIVGLVSCERLDGNEDNNYLIGTRWKKSNSSTTIQFISNSKLRKHSSSCFSSNYTYIFDGLKNKGTIYDYEFTVIYYEDEPQFNWLPVAFNVQNNILKMDNGEKYYKE
jgi:hypothetical protein